MSQLPLTDEQTAPNDEQPSPFKRTSKTGLRPCPFCGSVTLSLITFGEEQKPLAITCEDCGATGPSGEKPIAPRTVEELRVMWDTRAEEV